MEYKVFYKELRKVGGISALWGHMLDAIKAMCPQAPNDAMCLFAIYFSLVDAGNTAVCLKADVLKTKWKRHWDGLRLASSCASDDTDAGTDDVPDFDGIVDSGVACLLPPNALPSLVSTPGQADTLFVLDERNGVPYLFANKYYKAVSSVSDCLKRLFPSSPFVCDEAECLSVSNTYKVDGCHDLNKEQIEAIVRGKEQNIVLSGGPGTGKTTVVCFLLHYLLTHKPELINSTIYLAAPSGKAADRLKEGIDGSIGHLADDAAKKKISEAKACTIHSLLSYMAGANKFRMNKDNQFPTESVFVIDEASMIDVCIFQSLLESIPVGARLFILGDPYQLPSVQAGAVLGDMLSADGVSCRVDLVRANRFGQDSAVGRFAQAVKEAPSCSDWALPAECVFRDAFALVERGGEGYPIRFVNVPNDTARKKALLENVVEMWSSSFYADCQRLAKSIAPASTVEDLDRLWSYVEKAKILCASHEGIFGTDSINKAMCKKFGQVRNDNFVGQQIIITRNIKDIDLYNGDCGIVVRYDRELCFMVRKPLVQSADSQEGALIVRRGDYLFIPLYLISTDAFETAFAMTIHKSQGSGFSNILISLPEKVGHPLLNNPILYTAVTRTKGCTYILSSPDALAHAAKTRIIRDTMIEF